MRQPLSAQVKKGLARAFAKFNRYQLAKYNRDGEVKLRDVLFLCHAKPKDDQQAKDWKDLINGTLEPPNTWEVALSTGKDKKETWERLISEGKLGGLAFLRNLRNMKEADVSESVIFDGLAKMNTERILPFRFISAAKYAPQWEAQIESVMLKCLEKTIKLSGKTILVVDVSSSMYGEKISAKSELDRAEVACSLAILIRETCEYPVIYATAGDDRTRIHQTQVIPSRHGFALKDVIYNLCRPLGGGGIFLKQVMDYISKHEKEAERIIVITDEQDCGISSNDSPTKANAFGKQNYLINVASYKNGIGYGKWTHFDGWSESVLDYIREYENSGEEKNLN